MGPFGARSVLDIVEAVVEAASEEKIASHSGLWHSPPAATNATPSSHPCARRPLGVVNGLLWVCCVCVRVLPLGQDTSAGRGRGGKGKIAGPRNLNPMPQTEQKRTAHTTQDTQSRSVCGREGRCPAAAVF